MTNAQIIPDTSAITFYMGADSVQQFNPQIPLNGGPYDCTGLGSTAQLHWLPKAADVKAPATAMPYTVVSAGPGGFQCSFVWTDIEALYTFSGVTQFNGFVKETDGSGNSALIWEGTIILATNNAVVSYIA
jgi:hypothetical protein